MAEQAWNDLMARIGYRMFMEWLVLMGRNIDDTADAEKFTVAQMGRWCKRTIFLEDEATSDDSWNFTQDVPKLDSFTKWYTWFEAFDTALQCKRTRGIGIPMSYLIRKETETIQWDDIEDDDPRYDDLDTLLIQSVELRGPVFKRHNQLLFDNLKTLTIGSECWQFIQQLKAPSNRNGRAAFMLLKQQAEGDEARNGRVQAARDAIRNTVYHGKKNYPFSRYVTAHVAAHNILRQEKDVHGRSREPPKDDKVSDFLEEHQRQPAGSRQNLCSRKHRTPQQLHPRAAVHV